VSTRRIPRPAPDPAPPVDPDQAPEGPEQAPETLGRNGSRPATPTDEAAPVGAGAAGQAARELAGPGAEASAHPVTAPPVRHFAGRSLAGLVAVLGAGVGFGLLLVLVRLSWRPLYALDHDAAVDLNALVHRHDWMVAVLRQISTYGGRPLLIPLVVVVALALTLRRRYRLAIYLVVTGIGAGLLDPAVKVIVGRLRPVLETPVAHAPGNSFPSGHALSSFVVYGALVLVFLPALGRRLRLVVLPLAALLVFAIGLSRVALGVHFVSDVLAGWLLGACWLGVTGYAFRLWRTEVGRAPAPVSEGLEPEQARQLSAAPAERTLLSHPWTSAFELVTAWVLSFGLLYGFGVLVSRYTGHSVLARLDSAVPAWFAAHRSDRVNELSWWASKAGDTHAILAISLVFVALSVAVLRRLRPALFLALVLFGELGLFLASAAAVQRPRPTVPHLDGPLPTSSFPSGHIAATICLWWAVLLVIWPRTRAWWRWIFAVLAVLMPALVAVSRMYRGMHHPTDVAGAVLLAALLVTMVYRIVRPNADLTGPARAPGRPESGEGAGRARQSATIAG
jgi:membrane-associated phospholipid phosphatase